MAYVNQVGRALDDAFKETGSPAKGQSRWRGQEAAWTKEKERGAWKMRQIF